MPQQGETAECACGETIKWVELPADLAALEAGLWVHVHDFTSQCYEDDADCHAMPYEQAGDRIGPRNPRP